MSPLLPRLSDATVFAELRFWLLVVFSLVLPFGLYALLLAQRAISRYTVLVLGLVFVAIAGIDVYLLQDLARQAHATASIADDRWFLSELSVALYLLPALFGGIGINLVSHVLLRHLGDAEKRFERKHGG